MSKKIRDRLYLVLPYISIALISILFFFKIVSEASFLNIEISENLLKTGSSLSALGVCMLFAYFGSELNTTKEKTIKNILLFELLVGFTLFMFILSINSRDEWIVLFWVMSIVLWMMFVSGIVYIIFTFLKEVINRFFNLTEDKQFTIGLSLITFLLGILLGK